MAVSEKTADMDVTVLILQIAHLHHVFVMIYGMEKDVINVRKIILFFTVIYLNRSTFIN